MFDDVCNDMIIVIAFELSPDDYRAFRRTCKRLWFLLGNSELLIRYRLNKTIINISDTITTKEFGRYFECHKKLYNYNTDKIFAEYKEWYYDGKRHRDNDRPAIIFTDGEKHWYKNGKLHRDNNLPAIEGVSGEKSWYREDKRHRDIGPALTKPNGDCFWYQDGILHRDNDFPAVICVNGYKEYYKNGRLHRDNDLPAIEYPDGKKRWFYVGSEYSPL